MQPNADVLVIGLGGGNDVWAAKANGARTVRAIELNWPIVDIHKRVLRRFADRLVSDPSVTMVVDEGRSALMRDPKRYDVVNQSLGMDDRVGHAFQDDQDLITKRQNLFGKWLDAHAEVQH